MRKSQTQFFLIAVMSVIALTGAQSLMAQDSVRVTVVGTIQTGIAAIGGETTGTIIKSKNIIWELELGKNAANRKNATKLNGKKVIVQGTLARRRGVEIRERWIVTVTSLKAFPGSGDKSTK